MYVTEYDGVRFGKLATMNNCIIYQTISSIIEVSLSRTMFRDKIPVAEIQYYFSRKSPTEICENIPNSQS